MQILQAGTTGLVNRAMALLNKTILANPAVAITAGIAALVSSLVIFGRQTTEAGKVQKIFNDIQLEAAQAVEEEKRKLNSLLNVVTDHTKSRQQQQEALNQIIKLSPEYLNTLTLENVLTKQGTDAINDYINALQRKALEEAGEAKKKPIVEELVKLRFDLQNPEQSVRGINLDKTAVKNVLIPLLESDIKRAEEKLKKVDALVQDGS